MRYDDFSTSNDLFNRAVETIPLASQTFSKSAMNFVQGATPLFIERGEGAKVWDVDGHVYIDYLLGLLPIVLGYRDPDVDAAIRMQLERGITFSLASPLEMQLAERLVELIPCAEMVRFGKNGSDATSAAVRLARAHTGRDKVAMCGYHGWHDWYIGTTSRHLGVPGPIRSLSASFPFNDLDALEALLRAEPDGYAAVILEPDGTTAPAPGFLQGVKDLSRRYGAVLIFDEIVTGFRCDLGGAQKFHGVTPDLATFGKSMANGMPLSAVVGRREIMRRMEDIFFSGTFGGETLSLAAGLATLKKLEEQDVVGRNKRLGRRLADGFRSAIENAGMTTHFRVAGPEWRPVIVPFEHNVPKNVATSLLRQELVADGLLMGSGLNLCLAHDDESIVSDTLRAFETAVGHVAEAVTSNRPEAYLRGKLIQPVFEVRGG